MISPMLLTSFSEETFKKSREGWYFSEKYDGWRVIYTQNKFYTRAGNIIEMPERFYSAITSLNLPDDIMLDGEIWVGYDRFNDVASGIAGDAPLVYKIFDVPSVKGGFSERLKFLEQIMDNVTTDMSLNLNLSSTIDIVKHTYVDSGDISEVNVRFAEIIKQKGEGMVLRSPSEEYKFGYRSSSFMKYKPYDTTEAIVIGHYITKSKKEEEKSGYVSSLVCYLADDSEEKTFNITWKKTQPPIVGSTIVIRYTQHTAGGLPRFPVFIGMRDEKDLKLKILKRQNAKKYTYNKSKDLFGIVPERTKTFDEWKESGGFDLESGKSVWVESKTGIYKVTKAKMGNYYCSCPAWKYQRLPPIERMCKHCIIIKGDR